jgi:steroid delta-isomerase-like uncharacterized protein
MAQPDSASIARSFYEAWNERDFDRLAGLFAHDGEILLVGPGERLVGPEGARRFARMWADGFPDGKVTMDRVIAAGDRVVVVFTGRGTHTGMLDFPGSPLAATGRSVTLQLCDVLEVREGKIRSLHSYFDSGSLLMQLGALPEVRAKAKV